VEQAKVKDIDAFYKNQIGDVSKLKEEISNKEGRITSLKTEMNSLIEEKNKTMLKLSETETSLGREISVRESIHSEYKQLKEKFDSLTIEFDTLKQSINNKKVKEPKLV
jgi:chromosome segregation ATPase